MALFTQSRVPVVDRHRHWGSIVSCTHRALAKFTLALTHLRLASPLKGSVAAARHHRGMLDRITHSITGTPARLVRSGLAGFIAGTCALLLAALAQVVDGIDGALPAWAVPDSSLGLTAAALLVCWGVWAMGSGLRVARDGRQRNERG
jgi:hypothetical protein